MCKGYFLQIFTIFCKFHKLQSNFKLNWAFFQILRPSQNYKLHQLEYFFPKKQRQQEINYLWFINF